MKWFVSCQLKIYIAIIICNAIASETDHHFIKVFTTHTHTNHLGSNKFSGKFSDNFSIFSLLWFRFFCILILLFFKYYRFFSHFLCLIIIMTMILIICQYFLFSHYLHGYLNRFFFALMWILMIFSGFVLANISRLHGLNRKKEREREKVCFFFWFVSHYKHIYWQFFFSFHFSWLLSIYNHCCLIYSFFLYMLHFHPI